MKEVGLDSAMNGSSEVGVSGAVCGRQWRLVMVTPCFEVVRWEVVRTLDD